MRPGVLALQGDFAEHRRALESCGNDPIEVRSAADLERVDALIIPGGEATTMLKLMEMLEDQEDVQNVWANFDIDAAELKEAS